MTAARSGGDGGRHHRSRQRRRAGSRHGAGRRPEGRRCWSGGRENRCAETAALVADVGGQSLVRPADVTDEAAVEEVFAQAADELEGIDTAILAAGVGRYGPIESYPLADWEETLATNLTGPFLCAKAAIPHLRRNGGGAIVAVSSGAGKQGYPQLGAYSASKFGLMGLMQGLAGEVAEDGVKVCTVVPGSILTPFGGRSVAEKREEMANDPGREVPLSGRRRRGHPLPAAAAAARLDPGAESLAVLKSRQSFLRIPTRARMDLIVTHGAAGIIRRRVGARLSDNV